MALHEFQRQGLCFGDVDGGAANPVDQAGGGMVFDVPGVHPAEHIVRLVDGKDRPLGNDLQVVVGDQRGDLQDGVDIRIESGHLHVDPDQHAGAVHALCQ